MIDSLITSRTRIKLLIRFFLNPNAKSYLRELASEFGESTNSVRLELNRLSDAGLLSSREEGRSRFYRANVDHPLFNEIQSIVRKTLGMDQIVERVIRKLGDVKQAFLVGDYAKGIDSGLVDVVLVGKVDKNYLDHLVGKVERIIHRKLRILVLTMGDFLQLKETKWRSENMMLLWSQEDEGV